MLPARNAMMLVLGPEGYGIWCCTALPLAQTINLFPRWKRACTHTHTSHLCAATFSTYISGTTWLPTKLYARLIVCWWQFFVGQPFMIPCSKKGSENKKWTKISSVRAQFLLCVRRHGNRGVFWRLMTMDAGPCKKHRCWGSNFSRNVLVSGETRWCLPPTGLPPTKQVRLQWPYSSHQHAQPKRYWGLPPWSSTFCGISLGSSVASVWVGVFLTFSFLP